MRRAGPVFLAFPLLFTCACVRAASPDSAPLLQLEQSWLHAAESRDIDALRRILSDDYIDINYAGVVRNKADALRAPNVTARKPSQTLSQEKVRIYGATAVVTGLGTLVTGDHRYQWRFTDVFITDHGAWRAVSSQETPLQMASNG